MGFLERAIRRGVSDAVGNAIGSAVKSAVEPKVNELANKTAQQLEQTAANTVQQTQQAAQATQTAAAQTTTQQTAAQTGSLGSALTNLQRSMENYANEAAKNMKICPSCGASATADQKFCPSCGTKLPEQTVAQGAVCTSCGKQNQVGTKFCQECGAKLPAAIAEEQATAEKNAAVLAQWNTVLAGFPQWTLGGNNYCIEQGDGYVEFRASFFTAFAAQNAVEQYRAVLRQNGFRVAGEYADKDHLYNKINGVCYHVDLEHCFEGDDDTPSIYFMHDEPTGGFDYVKPEPKQSTGFFGLFR